MDYFKLGFEKIAKIETLKSLLIPAPPKLKLDIEKLKKMGITAYTGMIKKAPEFLKRK